MPKLPFCFDAFTLGDHTTYYCQEPKGHDGKHSAQERVESWLSWMPETQAYERLDYDVTISWTFTKSAPQEWH